MSAKTSIILCTYNEAKYIENTILELEKNIPNLEIVIGTISGNVNAPNNGVKATIFFSINLIY